MPAIMTNKARENGLYNFNKNNLAYDYISSLIHFDAICNQNIRIIAIII